MTMCRITVSGPALELALTARDFTAAEAYRLKLVTAVEDSKEEVLARAMKTAYQLSEKVRNLSVLDSRLLTSLSTSINCMVAVPYSSYGN